MSDFALLIKTKHTTVVVRMDEGDELDVCIPYPDSMSAEVMTTFTFDGNGVNVIVHHPEES